MVRILATVSNSWLHCLEGPDQSLARELELAFHQARQRRPSELVKIPPLHREVCVKTGLGPAEFDALQRQTFREPGIGDWSFQRTALRGPGEFMLVWVCKTGPDSDLIPGKSEVSNRTNSDIVPLSADEWLNIRYILP